MLDSWIIEKIKHEEEAARKKQERFAELPLYPELPVAKPPVTESGRGVTTFDI